MKQQRIHEVFDLSSGGSLIQSSALWDFPAKSPSNAAPHLKPLLISIGKLMEIALLLFQHERFMEKSKVTIRK